MDINKVGNLHSYLKDIYGLGSILGGRPSLMVSMVPCGVPSFPPTTVPKLPHTSCSSLPPLHHHLSGTIFGK